tara:strand:- start:86 stop:685 length:600 start_codon:yes stop_codon:yes gene_type:complete
MQILVNMKKKQTLQIIFAILTIFLSIVFFKNIFNNNDDLVVKKELPENSPEKNLIEGIQYLSKDVNGNIYLIEAKSGLLDDQNQDIIYLDKVNAKINFDNGQEIKIFSDKAVYNIENYDTEFLNNVQLSYNDHNLTCQKILAKFSENYAILSGNLIYKGLLTSLYADQMEIDLISRTTKTSMLNKNEKIRIVHKNNGIN